MSASRPGQWEGLTWLIITVLCISPTYSSSSAVSSFQYCQPWICSCYMNGVYYDAGQTWQAKGEPCITYKCLEDGSFQPDTIGVMFSDGSCKYLNETWSIGCFKYGVSYDGYTAKYRLLEGGCTADNGECLMVGDRIVQHCDTFECQIEGTCYSMVKVISGCSSVNHGCRMLHSIWNDQCAVYQCVPSDLGSTIRLHYHEVMLWPRGYYALLKPETGCPSHIEEKWDEGSRVHYGDGGNFYSDPYRMAGNHTEKLLEHSFCTHEDYQREGFMPIYQTYWDAGRYCILRFNGTCPRNFTEGCIGMSDFEGNYTTMTDMELYLEGSVDGVLPDGEFYNNSTLLQFCCRYDGELDKPLTLPTSKPFALFMAADETECQDVIAMESTIEFFSFADINEGYDRELSGSLPRVTTSDNNTLVYICHYKPLTCGCVYENGEFIMLGEMYFTNNNCVKYNCMFEELLQKNVLKLISGGCYDNGACMAEGSSVEFEVGEACYTRTCVRKHNLEKTRFQAYWDLENNGTGCRHNGICEPLDSSVNQECFQRECRLVDTVPKFVTISGGCSHNGTCVAIGTNITATECVTLQCKEFPLEQRTDLVVIDGGCYVRDHCYPKHGVWRHDCIDYVCEEFRNDTVVKYYERQTKLYCADVNNTCHPMGSIVRHKCWDYRCYVNGQNRGLHVVGGGCSHLGQCREKDEIWQQNCSNFTCKTYANETYFKWGVEYVNPACKLEDGSCIDEGANLTIGCTTYQCRKDDLICGLQPISGACTLHNGSCVPMNTNYTLGCSVYTCRLKDTRLILDPIIGGCSHNGTCVEGGAKFNSSCKEYECRETNGVFNIAMLSTGCSLGDGKCMKPEETIREGCYVKKCTATAHSCRTHYIQADCHVRRGGKMECLAVNTTETVGCEEVTCVKTGPEVFDVGTQKSGAGSCEYKGACYPQGKFFHPHSSSFCFEMFCDANSYASYKQTICRDIEGNCQAIGTGVTFDVKINAGGAIYKGSGCQCVNGGQPQCSAFAVL